MRDYLQADLISQDQYDGWAAAGSSSLLDRAAERTRELRESERAYAPAPDALRELDALVERARTRRLSIRGAHASAASTLSGVSGRSVSAVPRARFTALTTAGAAGTVAISPTLLAP